MNIKRIAVMLLAAACLAGTAQAKKMSDLKIYINPGHGGYTSNDRPIQIYPFAQNDTLGYWESKSNLYKGLHMYHILDSLGAKAYLSRTKNTENDDRSLSGIAAEANRLGVDLFFSIHSNAGENVNTPLMLYRENVIGTPRYPGNVTLSKIMWRNLHSNKLPVWTREDEYVVGDLTFYDNMWKGGLGVLRTLYVVGLLSEGSMHEHRPEAYRLMNDDYLWLEAWHFVKSIMEYEETEDRFVTGNVAGIVYDDHNLRERFMPVGFTRFGRDRLAPVNKATVELLDASGAVVQKRTTDEMYNGVFVFRNVKPGQYSVRAVRDDYYESTSPVTVTANEVTYQDMPLNMRREEPLAVVEYSPNVSLSENVSCASTIEIDFNHDIDVESFEKAVSITPAVDGYWQYSRSYRHASFMPRVAFEQSTQYTVTIDASARHADTHYNHPQMEAPVQFSFMTNSRNRLEVIDRFPADGGSIHYQSPVIEIRVDKTLNTSSINSKFKVTDATGKNIGINVRSSSYNKLSNGYGNAVFALSGSLTPGQKYHAVLSGELRDREGIPLGDDLEFDFTAIDASDVDSKQETVYDFEDACEFSYDPESTVGISAATPTAIHSSEKKLFGSRSGRFGYRFGDDHDGIVVWKFNGAPVTYNTNDVFGVFVNGDFNNHELWVGFAAGTNKKYAKICDINFLGWEYREVKLDMLEEDFCPFLLSEIRLVQTKSPITQNGSFCLDNIGRDASAGVDDIIADGNEGVSVTTSKGMITVSGVADAQPVRVYTFTGVLVANAKGNAEFRLAPGLYIVTAGSQATKVSLD